METLFEELAKTGEKPTPRERSSNEWIRPSTWALIDHKAALAREGKLNQRDRVRTWEVLPESGVVSAGTVLTSFPIPSEADPPRPGGLSRDAVAS